MADKATLLAEAYRRGLLPPEQKAAFEEARRRGLLKRTPYDKAKARLSDRDTERRSQNKRFLGPLAGVADFMDDAGIQVARNTGAFDEVAGGLNYIAQGGENIVRRMTGKPIEIPAKVAARAAVDFEREEQARIARERPGANVLATVGSVATMARPTGSLMTTNPLVAGGYAAAQNAPFAVARQEGTLPERIPGAAKETALVAGTAGLMTQGANMLRSRAANVRTRPASPARQLSEQGVELTPGQMLGGGFQRAEDAATSVPITGDAIRDARIRGIESFDRVALNRTLAPIGRELPRRVNVGRDGLREAERAISGAYDDALQGVVVAPDRQFSNDVTSALYSRQLPVDAADEVEAVLSNSLAPQFGRPIDGRAWKDIDSQLRAAADAADNASANRPSMRYARDAIRDIRRAFRGALERSNPEAFVGVQAADEATANLARIRQASQYTGTSARGGVFTPADLNRAVQGLDTSAGNREFARGEALLQDLSEPAMQVLPQRVPDSGTPFRSLMTVGGLSGLGVGVGANPGAVGAVGAGLMTGAGLYSRPVQGLLNTIYRASNNPGQAEAALAQLGALAARDPALVPAYREAAMALGLPVEGRMSVGVE